MAPPIPPRNPESVTGSRFMENARAYMGDPHRLSVQELDARCRYIEERAEAEFMAGNVPDFMRPENWREITVTRTIGNQTVRATVRVCPDYLAIGSNGDFTRIPMSPITAQRIADHFGFALPTMQLVDTIEDESRRLGGYVPFFGAPSIASRMGIRWDANNVDGFLTRSPEFAQMQNIMIEGNSGALPRRIIRSGHKKDVIYDPRTNLGAYVSDREGVRRKVADRGVAIYLPGTQPAAIPHEETFHDYSHGIRFVQGDVNLVITESNGSGHTETMSMRKLLNHRDYYRVLSGTRMDIDTLYRTRPQTVVPSRRPILVQGPPPQETRQQPRAGRERERQGVA
jgi:hypothetical protein